MKTSIRLSAALIGLVLSASAAAQVQRTFVASYGSDSNVAVNCNPSAPCRTFSAAQTVTNSAGEIVAIDAAGYGVVTITKSISILANPGVYAGISAGAATNGVTISASGLVVRLSGIKINGLAGSGFGIAMTGVSTLTIDGCTVTGFGSHGIEVMNAGKVRVTDSLVADNQGFGIHVANGALADIVNARVFANTMGGIIADSAAGSITSVAVSDSVSSRNGYGFMARASATNNSVAKLTVTRSSADNNAAGGFYAFAAAGPTGLDATIHVSTSKASFNTYGFWQDGTGSTIKSAGNNFVTQNSGAETTGTITNVGTM